MMYDPSKILYLLKIILRFLRKNLIMNKFLLLLLGFVPSMILAQPYTRNISEADRYVLVGSDYLLNQSYSSALNAFDKAIKLDNNHWCAYHFRATVLMIMDQHELALNDLNQAIRLNSMNPILFYKRGSIYDILGEKREAALDLQRALELAPEYPEARDKLDRLSARYTSRRESVTRGNNSSTRSYEQEEYQPYRTSRSISLAREYDIPNSRDYDVYEDRPESSSSSRTARMDDPYRDRSIDATHSRSNVATNRSYYPSDDRNDDFTREDKFRRNTYSSSRSTPRTMRDVVINDFETTDRDEVMSQREAEDIVDTFFDDEPKSSSRNIQEREDIIAMSTETNPFDNKESFDPYNGTSKKKKPNTSLTGPSRGLNEASTRSPLFETNDSQNSSNTNRAFSQTFNLSTSNKQSDTEDQPVGEDNRRRGTITYTAQQASPGNKMVYINNVVSTPKYTQVDFLVNGDDETITLPPPRVKLQVEGKVYHLYYGENTQPKTLHLKNGFPEEFSIRFQPIPEGTEFIKVISDGNSSGERWNYVFKLIEQ